MNTARRQGTAFFAVAVLLCAAWAIGCGRDIGKWLRQSKMHEIDLSGDYDDPAGYATDEDLAAIIARKNADEVTTLWLYHSNITDEGLEPVARLKNLTKVSLGESWIADNGLRHLAKLEQVQVLRLDDSAVSDDGLKHLANFKNLEVLSLYNTDVTDAGLPHLYHLTKLRELDVRRTDVSQEALEKLREALPSLEINIEMRKKAGNKEVVPAK